MQSASCCWHRLTACLEQCSTFPCCLPGFDSVGPTSPRHRRDFDPCFEPLVDDSGSESEQDEPTGPAASPRGGNPAGDGVKFTAAAGAAHPQAAVLEAPATATAPKKSSPIRTKLPLLADSPKKIKFGPPKKPPRHFDLATDGGGSAPPEERTSTSVPDRKTATSAAAATSSNSGGSRKLSPRQLLDKLRGGVGGGGDPVDERRLVTSGGGGGDKLVKQPAADSTKAPRKVCYDNQSDDLCSDDESRSKSNGLKNTTSTGECRSVRGNSGSGQLENIYVGLGGNKSSSDDTSAAIMEPEGIYAEVGWPKIAYYFINLLRFNVEMS
jgi:hypothetical protein